METAHCKHCNKEMKARKNKEYCSASCRAKASIARSLSGVESSPSPFVKPQDFAARQSAAARPMSQDPQSQYIISHLTKESERWEKLYNAEKEKREKLKEKNEELEKKIITIETEHRITAIESAKPSGLNGILQTDAGAKLIELCAPLIQRMMEPAPAAAQMAGTPGHQTPAVVFEQWFVKLTMPTQQSVWRMLQSLTLIPDAALKEYAESVIAQVSKEFPNQAVNQ